ncbi:MAG TPA: glycosyltransferase [Desulfomonilaceae bacterium]|nr:glycosyltransferase [Desulfomonilaceae bacterium]
MDHERIKRILVYTHNSIGLGHAFRTLAAITGIKKWRPDIDFLVISGSSIQQIFLQEGIEVIKLPSIRLDIDHKDSSMHSRYLSGFDLEAIFDFRQSIIMATFDFFQPDALIIEHNMTGQMSELIPLLMKKWMRKGGPVDFALAHICRGIMKWVPLLQIPYQNPRHRSESINIGELYDFMYVLEDREVVDINKEFLGDDPELEKKIRYLGKITNRVYGELPEREQVLERFGLPDRKIVLISLGRNKRVGEVANGLFKAFEKIELMATYQVVMVLDPYLDCELRRAVQDHPLGKSVRFLPFVPDLVELVHHSELVISRAGYNIVNEILLTGAKAILVPESHGGGEQEMRAQSICEDGICILTEDELLRNSPGRTIQDLLNQPTRPVSHKFDKYAIGKCIIEDLENWKARSRPGR